ncbi:kinase-like domain-containing protein, partial [Entophlyctis helioformis]
MNDAGDVFLADFGLAEEYVPWQLTRVAVAHGTPGYRAPEMVTLKEHVGPELDIWSMGVVLHELVFGVQPAMDANGTLEFPVVTAAVSPGVKDLIRLMLTVDRLARPSIVQVMSHSWLTGVPPSTMVHRDSAMTRRIMHKLQHPTVAGAAKSAKVAKHLTTATKHAAGRKLWVAVLQMDKRIVS